MCQPNYFYLQSSRKKIVIVVLSVFDSFYRTVALPFGYLSPVDKVGVEPKMKMSYPLDNMM